MQNGEWRVERLLQDYDVRCLALDPQQKHVMYAGTQGSGVLHSEDSGEHWRPAGLSGQIAKCIAVSQVEKGVIYAGTKPPSLFVSENGGKQWRELDSFRRIPSRKFWFSPAEAPGTAYVQGIALSPTNASIVVVGIEFGAVVRSEDAGVTWTGHRRSALRDCHSLTFHHTNGDWVYEAGGSGGGTALSRDSGKTWTRLKEGLDRHYGWACVADPADQSIHYCSVSVSPFKAHSLDNAQAYIFRSKNGEPWQKLTGGLPVPLRFMPYSLLTDSKSAGRIFAGLSNGEVWHSHDYGDSWTSMPFRLDEIHRMMIMT